MNKRFLDEINKPSKLSQEELILVGAIKRDPGYIERELRLLKIKAKKEKLLCKIKDCIRLELSELTLESYGQLGYNIGLSLKEEEIATLIKLLNRYKNLIFKRE